MQKVNVNGEWGQEIFINGLAEYVRAFIKHTGTSPSTRVRSISGLPAIPKKRMQAKLPQWLLPERS